MMHSRDAHDRVRPRSMEWLLVPLFSVPFLISFANVAPAYAAEVDSDSPVAVEEGQPVQNDVGKETAPKEDSEVSKVSDNIDQAPQESPAPSNETQQSDDIAEPAASDETPSPVETTSPEQVISNGETTMDGDIVNEVPASGEAPDSTTIDTVDDVEAGGGESDTEPSVEPTEPEVPMTSEVQEIEAKASSVTINDETEPVLSIQADAENKSTVKTTETAAKSTSTAVTKAIVARNGKYYYQENGKDKKLDSSQIVKVGNDYYYVKASGEVDTSNRIYVAVSRGNGYLVEGRYYSFYGDGRLVKISGIYKRDSKHWYYQDDNWALVSNKLVQYKGNYYVTDCNSEIVRNKVYNISSTATSNANFQGFHYVNANGIVELPTKKTENKEAINQSVRVIAVGKDNSVTVTVHYSDLPHNINRLFVAVGDYTSKNFDNFDYKEVNASGKKGSITLTFNGLAPNAAYKFQVRPYYVAKNDKGGRTTRIFRSGTTQHPVYTTSANHYKAYSNSQAQKLVLNNLLKRKSTSPFLLKISKTQYNKLKKGTSNVYDIFAGKLTANNSKRVGSLLHTYLNFQIDGLASWKTGNKYYLTVKSNSKTTAKQLKQYKQIVSWYSKGKKQAWKAKGSKAKIKILARYLMSRCSYSYYDYYHDTPGDRPAYSDRGVVFKKKAVCSGYSEAFERLCLYSGIKCTTVCSPDHAWNLVKVGKKWYHYDTTWNDCLSSQRTWSFVGSKQASRDSTHRKMQVSKKFKKSHPIAKNSLRW